jgi:hypothetical protein
MWHNFEQILLFFIILLTVQLICLSFYLFWLAGRWTPPVSSFFSSHLPPSSSSRSQPPPSSPEIRPPPLEIRHASGGWPLGFGAHVADKLAHGAGGWALSPAPELDRSRRLPALQALLAEHNDGAVELLAKHIDDTGRRCSQSTSTTRDGGIQAHLAAREGGAGWGGTGRGDGWVAVVGAKAAGGRHAGGGGVWGTVDGKSVRTGAESSSGGVDHRRWGRKAQWGPPISETEK